MLRKSPERYTFQANKYIENQQSKNEPVDPDYLQLYESYREQDRLREVDTEWQKDNMEYDLRTSDFIAEKCKDKVYAQNLYAAMCNNDFVKNDVWPILTDKRWSCSWRYAGGIVANIREEGDYIDWYCSGIRNTEYDTDTHEELANNDKTCQRYVSESVITDEIREDLLKLGWICINGENDYV